MKKSQPTKNAHTANTKFGMGDFYGTGIKAKSGRVRSELGKRPVAPNKVKPPKSLA